MTIRFHKNDLPNLDHYNVDAVAIDTETLGLNPHRDRLCVVQISPGDGSADVIQIAAGPEGGAEPGHASARTTTSRSSSTTAASILPCMQNAFGAMAEPVFCTKIASRLTRTYTDRHGLKDICSELLGVSLSKVQQSSDWAAETLTPEQLEYAASDVLYLHRLREVLAGRLARENRTEEADACFRFLPTRARLDLMGWGEEDIFAHS